MSYRVLVINPGSTSTKFAVYEDENPILVYQQLKTWESNSSISPR